jgi:hypothetical protein
MNNKELDRILKSARVPERPAEYWEGFPREVTKKARDLGRAEQRGQEPEIKNAFGTWFTGLRWKPALVVGLAFTCIVLGFVLGLWRGQSSGADPQLAEVGKYFREIAALFPNQLEAIVFDEAGAHMVLADRPNVPVSPPVYVKICGPKGCQRFVTFSGQQIRVNGDVFEVLVDRQGDVLLVGGQWVWSSSEPAGKSRPYRIEARALPANG